MVIIANAGKRCLCRCIKSMEIIIGKEKNVLFEQGAVYDCIMKNQEDELIHYKVYGDEFSLSCTDKEFKQNFILIQHKQTSR